MNNRGNIGIIALIAAALVGINYLPRGTQENAAEPAQRSEASVEKSASTPESVLSAPCESIRALLVRFYADPQDVPNLKSCCPPGKTTCSGRKDQPKTNLEFMVAVLPNPLHTHLPLFFDRAIDAIQQAAQDEGYSYDGSWFPWSGEKREYESLDDDTEYRARKSQIERQPGVMVFRRSVGGAKPIEQSMASEPTKPGQAVEKTGSAQNSEAVTPYVDGLAVFIVGEQPTHGIDDSQFENAMEWLSKLEPEGGQTLRILGPTFSGSLPSLERELRKAGKDRKLFASGLEIFSGTVSSSGSFDGFCTQLQQFPNLQGAWESPCVEKSSNPKFQFRTYNESDQLKTERFCKYLEHEGYDLKRLAILSEDQTDFGIASRHLGPANRKPICAGADGSSPRVDLKYPRDIAALRAAYERQSIFTAGKQTENVPGATLRGQLVEPPGTQYDTPRSYADQLDLLAQESLLQAIVVQLRMNSVQFVLIRATNSLDQIFLSQFLSRTYPQARIVLTGADLLFLRGGQGTSSQGIMALSTYPLLPGQQRWSRTLRAPHNGSYRLFGQDSAEGVYLAARGLLASNGPHPTPIPIYDSLPPLWAPVDVNATSGPDDRRAPTWLTVIGHGRFWPLAALNEVNKIPSDEPSSLLERATQKEFDDGDAPKEFDDGYAPKSNDMKQGAHLLFPTEMYALLILCSAMAGWQLYCCWCGSICGQKQTLTYFAPQPRREYSQLVFLGSLVMGVIGAVFAVLSGLSYRSVLPHYPSVWLWSATLWVVLCAVLSLAVNQSLPRLHSYRRGHRELVQKQGHWKTFFARIAKRRRPILISAGSLMLLIFGYAALLHLLLISGLTPANRFPTFWRAVNLFSFVSPLLPQILLLFGLRGWFWCNLHGLTLTGPDRPLLPKETQIPLSSIEISLGIRPTLLRLFAREESQKRIEDESTPLGVRWLWWFPVFLLGTTIAFGLILNGYSVTSLGEEHFFHLFLQGFYVASLGERHFGCIVFWWLVLVTAVLLTDTHQMLQTWQKLRQLLVLLDRLRLRRTLAAMKGIAWGSVWKMSGSVLDERYRVISRQFECLGNLKNLLQRRIEESSGTDEGAAAALRSVQDCLMTGMEFAKWYVCLSDKKKDSAVPQPVENLGSIQQPANDIGPIARFQEALARTAGVVLSDVVAPAWQQESESLLVDKSRLQSSDGPATDFHHPFAPCSEVSGLVRAAEEFVVIPYLGVIQNALGRIRLMAFGMLSLFLGMTLAVASYPFGPQQELGRILLVLFLVCGFAVAWVYGNMLRDATLSYVTDTNPGELGWQFWIRLTTFGIGPLLALLTALFPSLTEFLVSWIQPGAQAMK